MEPILSLAAWIHVVTSYSATNGIRPWVKGILFDSTGPFAYAPSNAYNTIALESSLASRAGSAFNSVVKEQFYGMMYELRVYCSHIVIRTIHISWYFSSYFISEVLFLSCYSDALQKLS